MRAKRLVQDIDHQTKSFEDMNTLLKAILKFCATNQLFKSKLTLKMNYSKTRRNYLPLHCEH